MGEIGRAYRRLERAVQAQNERRRVHDAFILKPSCSLLGLSFSGRVLTRASFQNRAPWPDAQNMRAAAVDVNKDLTHMANKLPVEYETETYRNSPDREILTPAGVRNLLQIGEKALSSLMTRGLPKKLTGNSYRFSRKAVLEWMANDDEGEGESPRRGSSPTRGGPSASAGGAAVAPAKSRRKRATETKPLE